jgi:hypothetical protein
MTACSRAAAVQRWLPPPAPLARASARQRSNVAVLTPTSRETTSTAELSGGSSRATILSLYACPYRATACYPRPQRFRSYPRGNCSDTGGRRHTNGRLIRSSLQIPSGNYVDMHRRGRGRGQGASQHLAAAAAAAITRVGPSGERLAKSSVKTGCSTECSRASATLSGIAAMPGIRSLSSHGKSCRAPGRV